MTYFVSLNAPRQSIIGDETLAYSMRLLTAELNGVCIHFIPRRVALVANNCTSWLGLSIELMSAKSKKSYTRVSVYPSLIWQG